MEEWRAQAKVLLHDLRLDEPALTDHLPDVVREIIRDLELDRQGPLSEEHLRGSPPVHGVQRFHDGLNVGEVVAEYNLLRKAFYAVAERAGLHVAGEAASIINHRIDEAIQLAVEAFAAQQELIRNEQQKEHLGFIAHDLRTPINAVFLLVEEIWQTLGEPLRAENSELFEMLTGNLDRLNFLTAQVMATSLPSTGGSSFTPEPRFFHLWPVVQRLILDLRPLCGQQEITIMNAVPRSLMVFADAGLISQVFQNLLANAFKYTPKGCIRINAEMKDETVVCQVEDDGSGVPAAFLDKIFQRSFTDPENPGTGLGLAIVKQIVEAHGGKVRVESGNGQGTAFSFTLPHPS